MIDQKAEGVHPQQETTLEVVVNDQNAMVLRRPDASR